MQTQALAAIRWITSDPRNNYTTVLLPYRYPIRSNYRVETVRREAFDRPGGTRPKVWNSTSTISVQRFLPLHRMAAIASHAYPKWPLPTRPYPFEGSSPSNIKKYEKGPEGVKQMVHGLWCDANYLQYYVWRPP